MIDGKELAKTLRKSNNLIIEKLGDDCYHVTDTYMLVKLTKEEYGDFFVGYNSYKSTANIPFDFNGAIGLIRSGEFEDKNIKTSRITRQVKEAKHFVDITEFYKRLDSQEVKIFKAGNEIGIFNRNYEFLIELGDEYKSKGRKSPLFVLNKGEIRAVIMPIMDRSDLSIKERFKELLKVDMAAQDKIA